MRAPSDGPSMELLLMLGATLRKHAELHDAIETVGADPEGWNGQGIPVATYSVEMAKALTDAVPGYIADSGKRPAEAVARIIQYAFRFGLEVGREMERKAHP
jgi:hypothetical protein